MNQPDKRKEVMKQTHTHAEKEGAVQTSPKRARLVKLKDSTRSASSRIEKILCDDCATVVAERRADGTIVIRSKHHNETHVTIIEPLKPVTESCFEEQ